MKIQHLIPILFLAAFCTVSAQTNTPTTPALLTTNQAEILALQIAKKQIITSNDADRRQEYYTNGASGVFDSNYDYVPPPAGIRTFRINGHWRTDVTWLWWPFSLKHAIVELAPDGSTNAIYASEEPIFDSNMGLTSDDIGDMRFTNVTPTTPALLTTNNYGGKMP